MSRSPTPTIAERAAAVGRALALALGAGLVSLAALPWTSPHDEGEPVRFQGSVADETGRPVADVEVALEAGRNAFAWRRMERERELARVTTRTDERGQFALEWPWDPTYRSFELVATLRLAAAGREVTDELARVDVADRIEQGSPVAATLTVENGGAIERLRTFVASIVSEDEQRVFAERGLPESVDRVESAGGVEAAWWYFDAGRVVRFRDGALVETQEFAPVRPLAAGSEAP